MGYNVIKQRTMVSKQKTCGPLFFIICIVRKEE